MRSQACVGGVLLLLLAGLGAGSAWLDRKAIVSADTVQAPRFEVDPLWPKPLPNKWILGQTIGVSVDSSRYPSEDMASTKYF